MSILDYYSVLEIPPSASPGEIKAAYRRLAHQYHPDKTNNDKYAAARFEIVKEAYEVLTNPAKKNRYLQQRWYWQSKGEKGGTEVVTPAAILRRLIALDKYVASLDVHRMDEQGLLAYLLHLLSNDVIDRLNEFNDPDTNLSIIEAALRAGKPLSLPSANILARQLEPLHSPTAAKSINAYLLQAKRQARWSRSRIWVIILLAALLSLTIYFLAAPDNTRN